MKKDKKILFEDRGLGNQRSYQTKVNMSTNSTKKEDTNNSFCKIQKKLLDYFAVNEFTLNRKKEAVNPLFHQIQNDLNVIVIPIRFFKHDKQIQMWIINTPNKEREFHLIAVLEALFDISLSDFKIMVI
jgi:hypothetical protein